jgi:hypothetical protein
MNFDWFIPAFLQSVKSSGNMGQNCNILPRPISQTMFHRLQTLPGDPYPLLNLFFASPLPWPSSHDPFRAETPRAGAFQWTMYPAAYRVSAPRDPIPSLLPRGMQS